MEAEVTEVLGSHFEHTRIEQLSILVDILKKKNEKEGELILRNILRREAKAMMINT